MFEKTLLEMKIPFLKSWSDLNIDYLILCQTGTQHEYVTKNLIINSYNFIEEQEDKEIWLSQIDEVVMIIFDVEIFYQIQSAHRQSIIYESPCLKDIIDLCNEHFECPNILNREIVKKIIVD